MNKLTMMNENLRKVIKSLLIQKRYSDSVINTYCSYFKDFCEYFKSEKLEDITTAKINFHTSKFNLFAAEAIIY